MSATWTSSGGIVLRDLVPAELRRRWVTQGRCPDRDLYALFSSQVRNHPRRTAVIDAEGALRYASLDARVRRLAAALSAAGLGPRDIVGIQVPNGWRAVAAELAVAAIGAVALPYPCRRGRRDALSLLTRARAGAVITVDLAGELPLAANLAGFRAELPFLSTIFVFGTTPTGCWSLDDWWSDPRADQGWSAGHIDPEAPARVLVSSGSETEPKMVVYSHNAMAGGRANYVAALHTRHQHEEPPPMRNLVLVSLASSYGSLGTSVTLAALGGTLLLPDAFDPAGTLDMITQHRPTHVFGVPTMLRRIAEHPRVPDEDTSSLHAVVSSAAALQPDIWRAGRQRFGCEVINVYGSADGVNCHTAGQRDPATGMGGAGVPDPRVADIRIVDSSGRDVPTGQPGEIWALGPMTPLCYLNAPELDARYRAAGGWVRTGDRGIFDPNGQLHVVDRIKQIINRGGYNISSAEVEAQITAHPAMADAVCVPVADPDLGERLCACVVQRPDTPTMNLREINAFLEDERGLERTKLPELLITLPEFPMGPTDKVCRQTLSRLAREQVARRESVAQLERQS